MALIDYAQVPPVSPPETYITHVYIHNPEREKDFDEDSEKWIDARNLNTQKHFREGSKALVSRRVKSGKWGIILVMEAV